MIPKFPVLVQFAMRFSRLHMAMENGADRAKALGAVRANAATTMQVPRQRAMTRAEQTREAFGCNVSPSAANMETATPPTINRKKYSSTGFPYF
jgi:hypothetical protein